MNLFPEKLSGEKLEELRTKKNLTRPALANIIGCCPHAIYQWEKGLRGINNMTERHLLIVLKKK